MTTIYEKSDGVFLDLKSCGSSIRWGVSVEKRRWKSSKSKNKETTFDFDFSICMTDCSRTVTWSADCSPSIAKKKLVRAIEAFRDALCYVEKADKAMKKARSKLKNKSA